MLWLVSAKYLRCSGQPGPVYRRVHWNDQVVHGFGDGVFALTRAQFVDIVRMPDSEGFGKACTATKYREVGMKVYTCCVDMMTL